MNTTVKIFHWIPRILCICAIAFVSLFSLDAFGHGNPFWEQILDWLMHMIPSFVLMIILAVAWKWETAGGIIFLLIGLSVSPWLWQHNYAMNQSVMMTLVVLLTIAFPFVIVGVLFLASHYLKKKHLNRTF